MKVIIVCLLSILWGVGARAQALRCEDIFVQRFPLTSINTRLLDVSYQHTKDLTILDVLYENRKLVEEISRDIPRESLNRAQAVSSWDAMALVHATMNGPFLAGYGSRYQRQEAEIGYCFGRAAFTHIALLKMGVQKESIRKIWLVGPMRVPGNKIQWAYHVATMVFVKDQGWRVLDSNLMRPVGVEDWIGSYMIYSVDGRAKAYVTDASKFAPNLGKYDRFELGLSLPREQDWYQGYFADMMKYFATHSLEDMGLSKVNRSKRDE